MKRSLIALALASLLPLSAQASELSYSYVEGGYASADWLGERGDGYFLDGSIAFNEHLYGSASYRDVSNNDFGLTLDETVVSLGYHFEVSDVTDLFAEIGYVNVGGELDGIGSTDSDGYRFAAGFRGHFSPRFEGSIKGYYTHLGGDFEGNAYGAAVGLVFHIDETWGVVGSYDTTEFFDEKINTWGVGVRASF